MHPVADQGSSSVPAFLTKLWTLLEDPSTNEFICWDATGRSFHVADQGRFSKEVLPMYFKHSNIASFIRQLNMYGFRKVVGIESGGLKVEKDDMEFAHPCFQRDKPNLLEYIKRKVPNIKSDEMKVKHDDVNRVLTDVRHLKGKQDNMSGKLDQLKRENELLWLEVASLRQKHMKQQQIVNKLIQFLVSLVGNRGVDRKRKMPLMINDASQLAAKKSRPRSRVSLEGTNFQVPSPEESTGQSTLSIHEVTDYLEDTGESEHLETPTVTDELGTTLEEPSIPIEQTDLITQDTMTGEPKDILDVLSEQSEILSIPATTGKSAKLDMPVVSQEDVVFPVVSFDDSHATTTTSISEIYDPHKTGGTPQPSFSEAEKPDNTLSAACMDAVLSSAAAPETENCDKPQSSVLSSVPTDAKTLQRSNSHPLEMEMSDHLDGLQSDLDVLKDLLTGGQYTFEPSTILNLFDLGNSILIDQPSTSTGDSGLISGHEVVQYNPPEDFSTLFDLGDLSTSTPLDEDSAEAALQEMVTQDGSTLNTPVPEGATKEPFLLKPYATSSTEEVD